MESSVLLKVFYIPKISFSPNQTITVKEGDEAELICINDGNDPNATTVWRRQGTNTNISKNGELNLKNVNRTDAGLYTCRVETKAGVYEDNAKVDVQYAPTIDIRYFPTKRKLKCIPNGIPDRYMLKDWEHTTEYNDHIRFLPIMKEGNNAILTIPENVTGKDHHRDKGIYICRASNNISSADGMFVMRKYNLSLNGTPYFVSSTENTQYGVYLTTANIKIKFVSVPEYNSYDVYKNGTKFRNYTESVYRNMKLTDNIYGENVSVKGSIISLQIHIDTLDDFSTYKIVVKNAIGSSTHTIKLFSASAPFMPKILKTSAKQTQIFVLWKPGFDGGYLQWFIVEYKEKGDIYWNNQTVNSSNSTVIGGLQLATKYIIRMLARNMIDESNRTEEIIVQTDESVSETDFSAIISLIAVLLCLLIIAAYFRRGKIKQFIDTR
ncbi:nephrin-like [Mytilus californianus]|uniref:nephrin-like n=1 Tax=Mytilus californianus TaxID=6549 RepID=UPI0022468EEC|nr:nephrin-like [Mytilus californianus]